VSAQHQKAFLTKLHNELLVDGDAFRKLVDIQFHTFVMTRRALRKGVRDRLNRNFPGITKAEVASILKGCDPALRKVIKNTTTSVRGVVTPGAGGVTIQKSTPARLEATFDASGQNRYDQIKRLYKEHLKRATPSVIHSIQRVLNQTANIESKSLWNLNHKHLEGIIETQVRDAIDNALLDEELITKKHLTAWMKKQKVSLDLVRDTKTKTAHVSVGSQRENSREGGITGAKKQKLLKELRAAIEDLEKGQPIIGMPGSDSFKEILDKEIVNDTTKPFRNKKNIKVSKHLDIKHSKKTTSKKTAVTAKALRSKTRRKTIASSSVKASPAAKPLQLIALLNSKLPETVQKKMNEPALVNRTGTFADSVRVVDATKTPKGFPSFGYTYDKEPYGVFEMGMGAAPWATPERDPRRIIDQSIREIAKQAALGRFFTRRI